MNINGVIFGRGATTEEDFFKALNQMLKEVEEIEDVVDGFEEPCSCGDVCWDEMVRKLMADDEDEIEPICLEPTDVIYSGPATIIQWNDGTKTVVKCEDGEEYNKEKGFVMAYLKKLLGNRDFFKMLEKWVWKNTTPNFQKKNEKRKIAQGKVKDIPEENVIEKIAQEIGVEINYCADDNNQTETEFIPEGDITKVNPVVCSECEAGFSVESDQSMIACPECGAINMIDHAE